jgi:uncharacterized protein (TIGR02328 family)
MRLWHKDLIKVLPQAHLVAQWRELSAIAGAIEKNGTPNHVLVNFVLDYDYDNFISYAYYIRQEMTSRGIRTMSTVWDKIVNLKPKWTLLPFEKIYEQKMDDLYLKICYYNLYEKYLCGMFDNIEPINEVVKHINL